MARLHKGLAKDMYTPFWDAALQRQALLQRRMDELREDSLFVQELFQGWKDFQKLPVFDEKRIAHFASMQRESLRFRQALQQIRQDLQQERKRWRKDAERCSEVGVGIRPIASRSARQSPWRSGDKIDL